MDLYMVRNVIESILLHTQTHTLTHIETQKYTKNVIEIKYLAIKNGK